MTVWLEISWNNFAKIFIFVMFFPYLPGCWSDLFPPISSHRNLQNNHLKAVPSEALENLKNLRSLWVPPPQLLGAAPADLYSPHFKDCNWLNTIMSQPPHCGVLDSGHRFSKYLKRLYVYVLTWHRARAGLTVRRRLAIAWGPRLPRAP